MRRLTSIVLAFLFILLTQSARAEDEKVTITFAVIAPGDTDPAAKLYVACRLSGNADWQADAILLKHQDNGEWRGDVRLPKGYKLDYKITGGSWETVEKGEQGEEIDNRSIICDSDKLEKIIVLKWRAMPTSQPTTQPAGKRASTATGDLRKIAFHSNLLNNDRNLLVWCPEGYENSHDRYPVLYMHDGQNVFDAATSFAGEWRADETAQDLIASGKIPPILIVGIENRGAERMLEYTPTHSAKEAAGGGAEKYAQFLVREVKPYIDTNFRTLPDAKHTGVCGSSLGGLVSLYICDKYPGIFGLCGAVSPSLGWDQRQLMMEISKHPQSLAKCRVWIDMGTKEGSGVEPAANVANARELARVLEREGMKQGDTLKLLIVEDATHNETAWAARLGQVLVFLFGPGDR